MIPHELVTRHILPLIKALIAHSLASKGLSQEKIARLLGVSQPMVSKYLRRTRRKLLKNLQDYGLHIQEIEGIVDIASTLLIENNIFEYYRVLTDYINLILIRGIYAISIEE